MDSDDAKPKHRLSAVASAPGKVILFGEHSVVHGKPAIAAALSDLRVTVHCEARTDGRLRIVLGDLKPKPVIFDVPASLIPTLKKSEADMEWALQALSESTSSPDSRSSFCLSGDQTIEDESSKLAVTALASPLYLIRSIVPSLLIPPTSKNEESSVRPWGLELVAKSQDLPVGAGLGSSAAFGVACAASLLRLSNELSLFLDDTKNSSMTNKEKQKEEGIVMPTEDDIKRINDYAFQSETLIHGTPSGIDNAVSTCGGAIYFRRDSHGADMDRLPTENFPPLDIVLTHTGVPRSTKRLVSNVRTLYEENRDVVAALFTSIGTISDQFKNLVELYDETDTDTSQTSQTIAFFIHTNQQLLRALHVSHESLEMVCKVATQADPLSATKLTGAGGGGCAVTYLQRTNDDTDASIQSRTQHLRTCIEETSQETEWNFQCLASSVGGPGVYWIV